MKNSRCFHGEILATGAQQGDGEKASLPLFFLFDRLTSLYFLPDLISRLVSRCMWMDRQKDRHRRRQVYLHLAMRTASLIRCKNKDCRWSSNNNNNDRTWRSDGEVSRVDLSEEERDTRSVSSSFSSFLLLLFPIKNQPSVCGHQSLPPLSFLVTLSSSSSPVFLHFSFLSLSLSSTWRILLFCRIL